jgi:hypothetical protein
VRPSTAGAVVRTLLPTSLLLAGVLLSGGTASAASPADLEATMRAWCSQAGTWRGEIEITAADGKVLKPALISRHRCTPDGRYHIVEEDFVMPAAAGQPAKSDHTLKVTYVDAATGGFHTEYFSHGKEAPYRFEFASVQFENERHWRQSIVSPSEGEQYEGRPAVLRYSRELDGDRLTSRKEVRFLDAPGDFVTRSLIVQTRVQTRVQTKD